MKFDSHNQKLSPAMQFFFGRIFPLFFLIPGGLVLFFGARSIINANNSESWPSASGVVISSEVDRKSDKDGTTYRAEVLYDYEVAGVTYSSNKIGYGDFGSSNPGRARKIVNKYPKGMKLEVYYKPDNPDESVLESGIQKRTYIMPALGSVFFISGALMVIFFPRLIRNTHNKSE